MSYRLGFLATHRQIAAYHNIVSRLQIVGEFAIRLVNAATIRKPN